MFPSWIKDGAFHSLTSSLPLSININSIALHQGFTNVTTLTEIGPTVGSVKKQLHSATQETALEAAQQTSAASRDPDHAMTKQRRSPGEQAHPQTEEIDI
jgi:hypothetical protein